MCTTGHDLVWRLPPADLQLSMDEVHVWRAELDLPASQIQRLQHTLSTDELLRAERFYARKDRQHFVVAHGLLRAILGRYLEVEPDHIPFCYSAHGKPALASTSGQEHKLSFNLS